jgi:hypothetical protein
MSKIFPLHLFWDQFFPDVALKEVRLGESTLEIIVTDSEWALEPEIVFFYGPGIMTFTHSGQPRVRWRISNDHDWTYATTKEIINRVIYFDMVTRNDNQWIFRFRTEEKGYTVEIILHDVTRITWSGSGEDLEDEE